MENEEKGIEEFPSNSRIRKQQSEEPQEETGKVIKKVASGKIIVKKKSFLDSLLSGTVKVVATYVVTEILIPAAKNTLSDMISNASDMFLFGEPKSRRRDRDRVGPKVSYTGYFRPDRDLDRDRYYERERRDRIYGRSKFDSDLILLDTREEAEDVIRNMFEIFDQYGEVTVSDFLELVDLPSEWTDGAYGWRDLREVRNFHTRRVPDGYIIELPDPKHLPK